MSSDPMRPLEHPIPVASSSRGSVSDDVPYNRRHHTAGWDRQQRYDPS